MTLKIEAGRLPEEGFIKLNQVLQVIPCSKTSWYRGIKAGNYPKPKNIPHGGVGWDVADIRRVIKAINDPASPQNQTNVSS